MSNLNKGSEFGGFRPIPKRFIVWDKATRGFYAAATVKGASAFTDIWDLSNFLNICQRPPQQLEIIQSTCIFDKGGKEIFEGSIISLEGYEEDGVTFRSNYTVYGYVYNKGGRWYLKVYESGRLINDEYEMSEALEDDCSRVVGHILANPELLEGEC